MAETQDLPSSSFWNAFNTVSTHSNHSAVGQGFTDGQVPTRYELTLMYNAQGSIGGFASGYYWSSTERTYYSALYRNFGNESESDADVGKDNNYRIRAIRRF